MKIKFLYIAIALLISVHAYAGNTIKEVELNNASLSEKLFASYNNSGNPEYYYSDYTIKSNNYKLTKNQNIRVFWDIWGNFIKIGLHEGYPLKKINNTPFSDKDYERLHQLLNNPHAGIQYYKLDDYSPVESENQYYAVDAMSGATVVNASYDCIRGAVKICYDLYKFTHGSITSIIKRNTETSIPHSNSQLSKIASMIINKEIASSQYFNSSITEKENSESSAYISTIIELARTSKYSNKAFNNWLESCFLTANNSESKTIIYNYLIQQNYKTKSIKNYLISHKI